jgi:glycosyltransferase involved in cell wall biosynthesis
MKIVYCLNSIRYIGGIQRVTVVKANALAEMPGNEVYIVVTDNKVGPETHKLSPKVHLIDLDINYHDRDRERSFIAVNMIYFAKCAKHKKALRHVLSQINPDIVISVGMSEKYMLTSIRDHSWKIIREFHCEKNYRTKYATSLFGKVQGRVSDFYEFNFVDKKFDRIVVLTQEDKETNWQGWNNVSVIPNPVAFKCDDPSYLNEKVVISMGRLHHVKNFSSLISAFGQVVKKHPDWILRIYGDGELKQALHDQIHRTGLQDNVFLMGFSNDMESALRQSSIFAFSSLVEGFALVIVEAMECGLPVVSYQCPCGPKDIVTDGKDGFLIPVDDEKMLAEKICSLIENEDLRRQMAVEARLRAQYYHVESIAQQWMTLFNEVIAGS